MTKPMEENSAITVNSILAPSTAHKTSTTSLSNHRSMKNAFTSLKKKREKPPRPNKQRNKAKRETRDAIMLNEQLTLKCLFMISRTTIISYDHDARTSHGLAPRNKSIGNNTASDVAGRVHAPKNTDY